MIYKCVIFYYFHLSTSEMLCNKKGRNSVYGHVPWPEFKFCLSSEHHEEQECEKSSRNNSVKTSSHNS